MSCMLSEYKAGQERTPVRKIVFSLSVLMLVACAAGPVLIRDVRILPQQTRNTLDSRTAEMRLVSESCQEKLSLRFDAVFFRPWVKEQDSLSPERVRQSFSAFRKNPGWGENRLPRDPGFFEALETDADLNTFPNAGRPAITTAHSDLRVLPTGKPVFRDFRLPGEGYPFDHLQVSSVGVNTPIRILHETRDKSWYYVSSHIASGWLPARDAAAVDSAFVLAWMQGGRIAPTADGIPVSRDDGAFLFHAAIGTVFPLIGLDSLDYRIRAAVPDADRNAVRVEARLPVNSGAVMPLPLTSANLAAVTDALIDMPYGWGGLFRNRDCSSALKDLFTPFGLMLPRHSAHQARTGHGYTDLSGLSPEEKEKRILREGVPFLTLLWLPGHIMLYVGHAEDRALAFHALWGIRTRRFPGKPGRKIVGRSVLTTLSPGRELRIRDRKGDILGRIQGMAFVVPLDSIRIP
ncbi:MAG TPA: hypothetical protein ENN17_03035 [bacterium]|nr:hypothetical protein [bacterium]